MNPQSSADALSQLQGFQSSRRKPQDVLKESQTRLGIPTVQQRAVGLRSAIGNTENLIRGVDPSVTGRTSGSLVSEAQKNRLVQLERAPLDETFRTQSQALQGEESNLSNLERNALTEAQLAISGDDQQQNNLQGIYSMLYQREADERARLEREAEGRRQAAAQAQYMAALNAQNNPTPETPVDTRPDISTFSKNFQLTKNTGQAPFKTPAQVKLEQDQASNRRKALIYSSPFGVASNAIYPTVAPKVKQASKFLSGGVNLLKQRFGF